MSWLSCGRETRETSWALSVFPRVFVQRAFCQQYICPVWSRRWTIKSVSMIPHDSCKCARYFSPLTFRSPSEPLFSAQFAFIRQPATDEDKQEAAHVTHSPVHFPGMIRGATVPSPAQREGQTGASHCTQTPGTTRGRRLYYAPRLLSGVSPGCTRGSSRRQVDARNTGILVKRRDYRATTWNGEINIKVDAWIPLASGIWKGRGERAISLCSGIVPGVDCKAVRAAR